MLVARGAVPLARHTLGLDMNQIRMSEEEQRPLEAEFGPALQGRMRRDPLRLAWVVTLASFAAFCVLLLLTIAGAVFAYRNYQVKGRLLLQPALGTVYVNNHGSAETIAVTQVLRDLEEGSNFVTPQEATQGVLGLFSSPSGGMLNSLQMSSSTRVEVHRVRRPFFRGNGRPHVVHLKLYAGQVRVVTLMPEGLSISMQIATPQGRISLADGVTRILVDDAKTEVDALDGVILIETHSGQRLQLEEGHRIVFSQSDLEVHTDDLATDILTNGSFQDPLDEAWVQSVVANDVPSPSMRREIKDGRWTVHFWRQVGDNAHNQYELRQQVDRKVSLNESLFLLVNLRIDQQSLPGAGDLSSEFPLRVEIGYTDIYGQKRAWGHGFFSLDPLPHYWIENGEQIPTGTWYAYESPNLMSLLSLTRPERIDYVRIHASGHDYDSYVGDISLITR